MAERLMAVLSGRRAVMTLLLSEWPPAQQASAIKSLVTAAENCPRLNLQGGLPSAAMQLQHQQLSRALYRGKGQLLNDWKAPQNLMGWSFGLIDKLLIERELLS